MSKEAVLNRDIKATNGGVEEKGRERKMRKENDKMDTNNAPRLAQRRPHPWSPST
jgi:hypothetical protein